MNPSTETNKAAPPASPTHAASQPPSPTAVNFLMQEYNTLNQWHTMYKEAGDARLASFVTMTGVIVTTLIGAQNFVRQDLGLLLLVGGSIFLLFLGLLTYRKMLQRRSAIMVARRKMARIRAWFLKYYPELADGMVYTDDEHHAIDWGRTKLGSTARYIAVINCALVVVPIVWCSVQIFSTSALPWALPLAVVASAGLWYMHIFWKVRFFQRSEIMYQNELQQVIALQEKYRPK